MQLRETSMTNGRISHHGSAEACSETAVAWLLYRASKKIKDCLPPTGVILGSVSRTAREAALSHKAQQRVQR